MLRQKAALGERTSHVDFALYGGVSPDRLDELDGLWAAGAAAFKIFTCDTGCAMKGVIDDADLVDAMTRIARLGGLACFPRRERRAARRQPPPPGGRGTAATTPPSASGTARPPSSRRSTASSSTPAASVPASTSSTSPRRRGVRLVERARGGGGAGDGGDLPALPLPDRGRHRRPRRLGHLRAADARPGRAGRHACPPRRRQHRHHRLRPRPGRSRTEAACLQRRLRRPVRHAGERDDGAPDAETSPPRDSSVSSASPL